MEAVKRCVGAMRGSGEEEGVCVGRGLAEHMLIVGITNPEVKRCAVAVKSGGFMELRSGEGEGGRVGTCLMRARSVCLSVMLVVSITDERSEWKGSRVSRKDPTGLGIRTNADLNCVSVGAGKEKVLRGSLSLCVWQNESGLHFIPPYT